MGISAQSLLSLKGSFDAAIYELGLYLSGESQYFLRKLQIIHDDTVVVLRGPGHNLLESFQEKMRNLAGEQNLEVPC